MPDFLLELLSEEIPARMQAKATDDLGRLFAERIGEAGLKAQAIETHATPRRLALIARGLPSETDAVSEELKGPRTSAPPQALEGFLRKTGLTQDQLEDRDGIWFARIEKPGRATADVLAQAIPALVRAFPWPKSMRWGDASVSTESLRWVRPLQGIVALLGEEIVEFEIAGIRSGAATVGHRFHHPGPITIGSANDYAEKLRACHVILDAEERRRIIAEGAAKAAEAAGLTLVEDEGLLHENAGLTEWPVPLLGRFDPAFLEVPREVIQLTMRTNQKYFALLDSSPERGGGPAAKRTVEGGERSERGESGPLHHSPAASGPPPRAGEEQASLAPAFVCVANIEASDGGAAIVAGNEKVLAARLADAKFFWEQDLKVPLQEQANKLSQIVFHDKLGTVADKVDRVAKLARWLVEEGIVRSSPPGGEGDHAQHGGGGGEQGAVSEPPPPPASPAVPLPASGEDQDLAALAERAARLAKADLVTGMVGEFPELQGVIGGHLARAQGEPDAIADAVRGHYKPVGQGDEVPTAPVTVAVSLADKLDTIVGFFLIGQPPSGSKDPYALRRCAIGAASLLINQGLRLPLLTALANAELGYVETAVAWAERSRTVAAENIGSARALQRSEDFPQRMQLLKSAAETLKDSRADTEAAKNLLNQLRHQSANALLMKLREILDFFADRLKVQQREAGVRHDLIDAVFALGGEDDLVRLLARVKALQAFVETPEGADLLAGYKRAANILKKEDWAQSGDEESVRVERSRGTLSSAAEKEGLASARQGPSTSLGANGVPTPDVEQVENKPLSYTPEKEEAALIAALDSAEPAAAAAVEKEDFEGAMAALATLRGPVDAFFDKVTVNDPDPAKRAARLDLLARMRGAFHRVADFSRIEG